MNQVSLIMATAGRTNEISDFFASLEKQTSKAFELIIVDQNDDARLEPIVARAQAAGLDITHLQLPLKNLSKARNSGTAIAKYELVAYPDDDCWYDDRVIEGVISRFDYDARLDGLIARWVEEDSVGAETSQLLLTECRQFRGIQPSSITLFLKKALVQKIGGFDERLGVPNWFGSAEETDLVMRCLGQESTLQYMPDILVHHPYGLNPHTHLHQLCMRARNRARGTGALYVKNQLPFRVIARGLFSPLMRAVARPFGIRRAIVNSYLALGRIEGLVKWAYTNGRGHNKSKPTT